MLLGKSFDNIDGATVESLIANSVAESVHLEFKQETYESTDDGKKEFLKDISAFANSSGGHLLIGIEDADGAALAVKPLDSISVEAQLLRLEQMARTGVEPNLLGLRMMAVQVDGGAIIVIQVPPSFNPPHRVTYRNTNRYRSEERRGGKEC